VELVGEAYFEVAKNNMVPFNVRSRELNVQVLGVKFGFRNYLNDKEVMVALLEGEVSFVNQLKKASARCLSPDEKVVLDRNTGDAVVSSVKATNVSGWTSGELLFDEELLTYY
jgi:transmembrane sensor